MLANHSLAIRSNWQSLVLDLPEHPSHPPPCAEGDQGGVQLLADRGQMWGGDCDSDWDRAAASSVPRPSGMRVGWHCRRVTSYVKARSSWKLPTSARDCQMLQPSCWVRDRPGTEKLKKNKYATQDLVSDKRLGQGEPVGVGIAGRLGSDCGR